MLMLITPPVLAAGWSLMYLIFKSSSCGSFLIASTDSRVYVRLNLSVNCSACHQPTGKGLPPAFPGLVGSKIATGPKPAHIGIVLKGKPGTAMAAFAQLSDADLAAVVTYERTAWGNSGGEVMPAEVAAARK